jgi:PEP-CTERM motif
VRRDKRPLSGGVGKLTAGVSPALSWYQYGEDTPWVGWYIGYPNETDPIVTFNFAGVEHINSVTVWVDNALGYGGVSLPSSVAIDGTDFPIAPDNSNPAPRGYTFSSLDITGSSVNVQFFQSNAWVMVVEVSFSSGVPEPATWAMMLIGFAGLGVAGYRSTRKNAAVAA